MSQPSPKKVGTINGRAILEGSAELLALLSEITVDTLPVPSGANQSLRNRLRQRQKELQSDYQRRLRELPDDALAANADTWSDQAKTHEAARRKQAAEQTFRDQHGAKRRPGLERLRAEAEAAGDETAARLAAQMISEWESQAVHRAQLAEAAERRAAFLAAERQRLSAMTLDELLQVKTSDYGIEQIVAELVIPQCTTVKQIADQVVLSASAVRTYLDDLRIAPCYMRHYRTGHDVWRKDVTAHYYRPNVIPAILAEIRRRDQQQQVQRMQSKERREEMKEWKSWERGSGIKKPT